MNSITHPLRVDFIVSEEFPILNKLGMTFAPGKTQSSAISGNWNRDLAADLTRLREFYHADTLVSLIEDEELITLQIRNLEHECRNHEIELLRFPLRDVSIPTSLKEFARLIQGTVERLNENKTVVIHCKGGLGRAGMTTACAIIVASGNKINGAEAIKMVRAARKGTVETPEQERFVSLFGDEYRNK
jgi:protein-tyrosine phosphatase